MQEVGFVLIGLFLPLFPLSMVFNGVLQRVGNPVVRSALMLAWPQIGLLALSLVTDDPPSWIVYWALATCVLYAFRLLAMREMGRWAAFLATSAWAVLWLPASAGVEFSDLWLYAAAFSVPLIVLTFLANDLEQRFGAAYAGLYGGLALSTPRFAGVLVMTVLAATATPLFPAFFAMMGSLVVAQPVPVIVTACAWVIWSWAAARLIQGFVVGPAEPSPDHDLSMATTWGYGIGLTALIAAGLVLTGSKL